LTLGFNLTSIPEVSHDRRDGDIGVLDVEVVATPAGEKVMKGIGCEDEAADNLESLFVGITVMAWEKAPTEGVVSTSF